MRKWIMILACLVLVCTLFLGLAGVGSAAAKKDVTLTFWSWRTEDVDAYTKFIQVFNKKNPNINVKFIPYKNTEYNTILSTALQGGSGPDIMQLRAYGGMEPLANAGYLRALDGLVPELKGFDTNVLQGARSRKDQKIYGVPFAVQSIQVLYNKKIFTKLKLKVPTTWGQMLKVAQTVKNAGLIPFANGTKDAWTLETMFGGVAPTFYGGDELNNQIVKGQTNFEDARLKQALSKMLELRPYLPDNYTGVGYTDMQMMFAQEMAAMFIGGSYELGTMAQMNPNLEIGAFIVPGETASAPKFNSTYVDGSYGINAATKYPDEALKFIRFLAGRQYGQLFTDNLKQISAVPNIKSKDAALNGIIKVMKPTPYLMLTGFRYGTPSGSTLLQNEVQALFAGAQDIDKTLKNIQTGVATWYEPFKK